MNKARRKQIEAIHERLTAIGEEIEALAEEERDAYDNLPPSIQESERGEVSQTAADALDTAATTVEEAAQELLEAAE